MSNWKDVKGFHLFCSRWVWELGQLTLWRNNLRVKSDKSVVKHFFRIHAHKTLLTWWIYNRATFPDVWSLKPVPHTGQLDDFFFLFQENFTFFCSTMKISNHLFAINPEFFFLTFSTNTLVMRPIMMVGPELSPVMRMRQKWPFSMIDSFKHPPPHRCPFWWKIALNVFLVGWK